MRFAFFDLDDTLVDAKAALRAWSVDFAAEYVPEGRVPGVADAASDVYERVDAAANWRAFLADARQRYGITAPDAELMAQVAAVLPKKFVLEQQVRRGLAELRGEGWRLGVVTNGSTLVQQAKVDSIGLRSHVDVVVDSEAAGHRKPDRRIFEIAAGELGVELGPRGWMVGDRLDKDVAGGAAAGLRTIWISQDEALPAGAERPTCVAASISEAFEIVRADATGHRRPGRATPGS
jgi:HAD superfamily hydrolase (TIGR01549 family)